MINGLFERQRLARASHMQHRVDLTVELLPFPTPAALNDATALSNTNDLVWTRYSRHGELRAW